MKKAVIIFSLIALAFAGCQKDEFNTSVVQQELVFGIELIDPVSLKNDPWNYTCYTDEDGNLLEPAIAQIEIKDKDNNVTIYYPPVYYLNDKLFSQSIKLNTGDYTITKFLLWTEHPVSGSNPKIVMATPETNAEFSEYVSPSVPFDFPVGSFVKTEINIEVLCFLPQEYDSFGFTWLELTEIVVRELCFFGDICANGEDEITYQEEIAFGGNHQGPGFSSNWWYYYDTQGLEEQPIYAGQELTDGTVKYQSNQLIIDLGSWELQDVSQPVKIQWYANGALPGFRPDPVTFAYKGNQLIVNVPSYRFYVIHLDIMKPLHDPDEAPYKPEDFAGSDYEDVPGGLQVDMPAIFKIHAFRNDLELPKSPFYNIGMEDEPLCVRYPDRIRISDEVFTFELHILVPDGQDGFHYQYYHTFTSIDDGPLDTEDLENDGVIDFVLGTCNYSPTDLQLGWD
jgi:uncharacterized protein YcfL